MSDRLTRDQRLHLEHRLNVLNTSLNRTRQAKLAPKEPVAIAAARAKVAAWDAERRRALAVDNAKTRQEIDSVREKLLFGSQSDALALVVRVEKEAARG